MDSFPEYKDKLKASMAFANKICPKELILNLSEKCLLLIEEINRHAKIEEPFIVSRYSVLKTSNILLQNSRKMTITNKEQRSGFFMSPNEENIYWSNYFLVSNFLRQDTVCIFFTCEMKIVI